MDNPYFLILVFAGLHSSLFCQNTRDTILNIHEHSVFFKNNSFEILDTQFVQLKTCIDSMTKYNVKLIELEGHTNQIGSVESNQKLSDNRIKAVSNKLIEFGLDSTFIKSKSLGKFNPRFSNQNEEGLKNNRQVVIGFQKKLKLTYVEGIVLDSIDPIKNIMVHVRNKIYHDSTRTDSLGKFKLMAPDKLPISIYTIGEGYFTQGKAITPDSKKNEIITVEAISLRINREIKLSNILFVGNKNILLPGSENVVHNLTTQFLVNKNHCFEIQGHVNGPGAPATYAYAYMDLSKARAGRVYFMMVDKGIKAERMNPVGYAHLKMLYPNNPSGNQQQQNRRVVIKILDCKTVKEMRNDFDESLFSKLTNDAKYADPEALGIFKKKD